MLQSGEAPIYLRVQLGEASKYGEAKQLRDVTLMVAAHAARK